MVKVRVIKDFNLKEFTRLKNIVRYNHDKVGELYKNDTFECDDEMVKYLTGDNPKNEVVVEIIEIIVEKLIEEPKKEVKPSKKVAKK